MKRFLGMQGIRLKNRNSFDFDKLSEYRNISGFLQIFMCEELSAVAYSIYWTVAELSLFF